MTDTLIEQQLENDQEAIGSFLTQLAGDKQAVVEANCNWYGLPICSKTWGYRSTCSTSLSPK